jgi:N-acylneuraminate cytidylyltransferase/CMP-N,N'-diacetyllegionaminic acid synthase
MWFLNGAIYLNACDSLRTERTFFPSGSVPYPMPQERSLDVDSPFHFFLTEQLLKQRHDLL